MGGYGSGQRFGYVKSLIEDSYKLSMKPLKENIKRVDLSGVSFYGDLQWSIAGRKVADISYRILKDGGEISIWLIYLIKSRALDLSCPVPIQTTAPPFGGRRYWFTCPLVLNGRSCQRRVGMLFLPPGGNYFGCRHCHDLTYTSCRESHKWDAFDRSIGLDPTLHKLLAKGSMKLPKTFRELEKLWKLSLALNQQLADC